MTRCAGPSGATIRNKHSASTPVVHRDPGEAGKLLTAKARGPTPTADRNADSLRRNTVTPAAHRFTELRILHRPILPCLAKWCPGPSSPRTSKDLSTVPLFGDHSDMTTTLITGANKGLGKETARLLVAAGHIVWVAAREQTRGRAAAEELGARFVQLDVTDDASIAAAFATIADAGTGLDVLVNNAGIAKRGADGAEALDGPSVLEVFDTNAVGIVRVTEAALALLQRSPTPVIVNVSSALGSFWATHEPSRPASRFVAIVYGSSKAAVSMLTVQYARAYPGIRINAVETRHHRHRTWRRRPGQPPRAPRRGQRAGRRAAGHHRPRRTNRNIPGRRRRTGLVTASRGKLQVVTAPRAANRL